jgi:hypothetical protein
MRLSDLYLAVLLTATVVVPLAVAAETEQEQVPVAQTRFERMVRYLQTAESKLRSDFAIVALSKVADAYAAEARLARQQAGSGTVRQLGAWSATVDRYANQMPLLIDDIDAGLPVRFNIGEEKSLAITVGDRTVIVSNPRLSQQGALEQSILNDFCSAHSCAQFTPPDTSTSTSTSTNTNTYTDSAPIPVSTAQVHPSWDFAESGSNCSLRSITVHFDRSGNMSNARLICEQFLQEVTTLSDELAWQQRHQVVVEWESLEIKTAPGRPEHMVQLNAAGDAILVSLPLLRSNPGLLKELTPWIRAHAEGRQEPIVVLDASQYGWQKP